MSNSFTATSCPTDRGDRLKAVRRLMCQLSCYCPISMMLQACLLLQHLPLLQEVIHKFFSYRVFLFFSCYLHGQETLPIHYAILLYKHLTSTDDVDTCFGDFIHTATGEVVDYCFCSFCLNLFDCCCAAKVKAETCAQ